MKEISHAQAVIMAKTQTFDLTEEYILKESLLHPEWSGIIIINSIGGEIDNTRKPNKNKVKVLKNAIDPPSKQTNNQIIY